MFRKLFNSVLSAVLPTEAKAALGDAADACEAEGAAAVRARQLADRLTELACGRGLPGLGTAQLEAALQALHTLAHAKWSMTELELARGHGQNGVAGEPSVFSVDGDVAEGSPPETGLHAPVQPAAGAGAGAGACAGVGAGVGVGNSYTDASPDFVHGVLHRAYGPALSDLAALFLATKALLRLDAMLCAGLHLPASLVASCLVVAPLAGEAVAPALGSCGTSISMSRCPSGSVCISSTSLFTSGCVYDAPLTADRCWFELRVLATGRRAPGVALPVYSSISLGLASTIVACTPGVSDGTAALDLSDNAVLVQSSRVMESTPFNVQVGDVLFCACLPASAGSHPQLVFGVNRRLLCSLPLSLPALSATAPDADGKAGAGGMPVVYPCVSVWGGAQVELLPTLPSLRMSYERFVSVPNALQAMLLPASITEHTVADKMCEVLSLVTESAGAHANEWASRTLCEPQPGRYSPPPVTLSTSPTPAPGESNSATPLPPALVPERVNPTPRRPSNASAGAGAASSSDLDDAPAQV